MAIVSVVLGTGTGVRMWGYVAGFEDLFSVESISTSSGLTRQLWDRDCRV